MAVTFGGRLTAEFAGVLTFLNGSGLRGRRLNISLENIANHAQQIVAVLAFGNEAMSTGGDYLLLGLIGIVDGENHNLSRGAITQDLAHRNQTVQNGHIDVENHQVGVQFPCLVNGVLAVDSFAAYFKIRLSLKSIANAAAKHLVVVSNQNLLPLMEMRGRMAIRRKSGCGRCARY